MTDPRRLTDLEDPCLGRTFLWTEDSDQLPVVETYRDEKVRSDVVRVRFSNDEKIICSAVGYLMDNITT